MAVLTLVFGRLADISSEGIPYPLFALLGFTVWTYFSASVGAATTSLVANASLVTKVYFARLVAPLAALLPGLIGLGVGLVLVAALMAGYGVAPGPEVLALPLCLIGLLGVTLGPGLLFGALNVKYRDVGSVLGLLIQLWFLVKPGRLPEFARGREPRYVYAINPVAGSSTPSGGRCSTRRRPDRLCSCRWLQEPSSSLLASGRFSGRSGSLRT